MSISIETILSAGVGLITTAVGMIGMWFKFQNKVDNLEKEDSEQARQLEAIWSWKDSHEKEAALNRENMNREIFKLEGANLVVNEQYKTLVNMLQDIKERIEKLERRGL